MAILHGLLQVIRVYKVGNVHIITHNQNSKDYVARHMSGTQWVRPVEATS
jgi:hypothetical protein